MRRADRLFEILLLLGRGKVLTARRLAERLEISERTVYRDVQDLMACGVPIDGEAGVGYVLRQGYHVPPLMFTPAELHALALGTRIVQGWVDRELAQAAQHALAKIEAALPAGLKPEIANLRLFAPTPTIPALLERTFSDLRKAIADNRKVRFAYHRADGAGSHRTVRPLGLFYWGAKWTLGSWCELREDFRDFRVDRVEALETLPGCFTHESGKTLRDYLQHVCATEPTDHSFP